MNRLHVVAMSVVVFLLIGNRSFALEPDHLALIVNENVPESLELAEFYAKARGLPSGRIIKLDLPAGVDEIPFEDYEQLVAEPVRQFLTSNNLKQQVKCVVTFHGVPLRVARRTTTPELTAELEGLKAELRRVQEHLATGVGVLERVAIAMDPTFRPLQIQTANALARRADQASKVASGGIANVKDDKARKDLQGNFDAVTQLLNEPIGDPASTQPATSPAAPPPLEVDPRQLQQLLQRSHDPGARDGIRTIARRTASPFAYERVLQEHLIALNPEHSDSAIDSELALLWVGPYQRAMWTPNPLGYPFVQNPTPPHIVMVMRLDAPRSELVRQIIETSIAVERDGLQGRIVIDSRGLALKQADGSQDAFGAYDQRLRELARIIRTKTHLKLVHDDKPEVLPVDAGIADVALYCGWYSVGSYVPSMRFSPGAVGYHIASYEMTSLRDPNNNGWCRGMLNDGIAATLGAVSEPLLHAFPVPDDFFPLLLTGRLTLAEVYWRTTPLTSWKVSMIGDPLYTPFKRNPALRIEDLPERLRPLFSDEAISSP